MENVERYQSLSKKTAIQIILCDKHRLQVRRTVFLQPNFKRLCKLGKHPLSFSQGQLDPGSPAQAYLTVTDEAVCRGGGVRGRWESQKGMAATPRRNSDSLASACCQSVLATPGPGAATVSTHFHTWTNSQTGQEKQPTHPYLSPCPPSTFPLSKNSLSGAPWAAF